MSADDNPPFAIMLDTDLLDRLTGVVQSGKARSVSALIRDALEPFDFDEYQVIRPSQKLISVRLPIEVRDGLKQAAETKQTTVTHLVRTALEHFLVELDSENPDQLQIPLVETKLVAPEPRTLPPAPPPAPQIEPPAKIAAKPARKKSAARAKKPAAKKSAAKKPVAKKPVRKTPAPKRAKR